MFSKSQAAKSLEESHKYFFKGNKERPPLSKSENLNHNLRS